MMGKEIPVLRLMPPRCTGQAAYPGGTWRSLAILPALALVGCQGRDPGPQGPPGDPLFLGMRPVEGKSSGAAPLAIAARGAQSALRWGPREILQSAQLCPAAQRPRVPDGRSLFPASATKPPRFKCRRRPRLGTGVLTDRQGLAISRRRRQR